MAEWANAIIGELEQESESTRRMLEKLPSDKLDWKPHPKSMSLGHLAMHIARNATDISAMASSDHIDFNEADFKTPEAESVDQILGEFENGLTKAKEVLGSFDDSAASTPWTMSMGGKEIMTIPKGAMLRSFLLNHWYHHRGQLGVYLRLLDVPVPSVYGPTADDNPFE